MPVWPALCDLGAPGWGALVSAQCCVVFLICLSYGVLVLFLVRFFFLAISIHLIMHKLLSLQPCWPGQFFTMPLVALCVFGVFGVWFCLLLFLFCFLFIFSAS